MHNTETHPGPSLAEYDAEHPLPIEMRVKWLTERIEKLESAKPRKEAAPNLGDWKGMYATDGLDREVRGEHTEFAIAMFAHCKECGADQSPDNIGNPCTKCSTPDGNGGWKDWRGYVVEGRAPAKQPPAKTRGQEVAESIIKIFPLHFNKSIVGMDFPDGGFGVTKNGADGKYTGELARKCLTSLIDAERADAAKQENAACVKWLTDAATCHDREMRKGNASYDREFHETQSRAARGFAKEIALNPKPTFG